MIPGAVFWIPFWSLDEQSIAQFEQKLQQNLYKAWNRISSGSYFPPAVRQVETPKQSGGKQKLGIPMVCQRCHGKHNAHFLERGLMKCPPPARATLSQGVLFFGSHLHERISAGSVSISPNTAFTCTAKTNRVKVFFRKKCSRQQMMTFLRQSTGLYRGYGACAGAHFVRKGTDDHGASSQADFTAVRSAPSSKAAKKQFRRCRRDL